MRGLLVLAGAAMAVVLGVLAIAGLILPDAVTPAAPEAAPDSPDPEVVSSIPVTPAPWPPDNIGGAIEVTGDRPGLVEFDVSQSNFGNDTRFELASNDSSMLFGEYDGMLFVDQMTYDGLNFFLDPGDCGFTELGRTEDFGLVRLEISCPEVTDIQSDNTVTIEGLIDVPLLVGAASEYGSGGTLALSGDVEADLEVPGAFWYDYPEESCTDCQLSNLPGELRVDSPDSEDFAWDLQMGGLDGNGLFVQRLTYQHLEFRARSEDCAVTETSVIKVGPDTELLQLAIDCPELISTDGESILSLSGTLRVHHIMVGATIFRP